MSFCPSLQQWKASSSAGLQKFRSCHFSIDDVTRKRKVTVQNELNLVTL